MLNDGKELSIEEELLNLLAYVCEREEVSNK